jgi:hypothetical protein
MKRNGEMGEGMMERRRKGVLIAIGMESWNSSFANCQL